jgi:hypothetical protein
MNSKASKQTKDKTADAAADTDTTDTNTIIVDINVANYTIRGTKPIGQFQNDPMPVNAMPVNEVAKIIWLENVNPDRLNYRVYGELKGKALKKAQKIVNANGSLSTSGEYGYITIQAQDFVPFEWNEMK